MQLASLNPLPRTNGCWLGNFLQGLLGNSLQNALDLCPLFRRTFAELSRKYPYPQAPAISRGAPEEKQTPGPLVFGSRKPSLLKLGCCIWSVFLETSKSNVRQGGASRPWYVAHLRKLGCYEYLWSGAILLPDPGRQEVVALNKL